MDTGILTAKSWILTASSGTLSYLLNDSYYSVIDAFRDFVFETEHTSVEDYVIDFYTWN